MATEAQEGPSNSQADVSPAVDDDETLAAKYEGDDIFTDFLAIASKRLNDSKKEGREKALMSTLGDVLELDVNYINSRDFKLFLINIIRIFNRDEATKDELIIAHQDLLQELKLDLEILKNAEQRKLENKKLVKEFKGPKDKRDKLIKKLNADEKSIRTKARKLKHELVSTKRKLDDLKLREIDSEEMNDDNSSYVRISRYEKRILKIHEKLRKLEGVELRTGRQLERRFVFNDSHYSAEINKAISDGITRFLNSSHKKASKSKEALPRHSSPNVEEIKSFLENCKEGKSLKTLNPRKFEKMAGDILKDVVRKIKLRREAEHNDYISGYLSDEETAQYAIPDPKSKELEERLKENHKINTRNLITLSSELAKNHNRDNADVDSEIDEQEEQEYLEDLDGIDEGAETDQSDHANETKAESVERANSDDQVDNPKDDDACSSSGRSEVDAAPDRKHRYEVPPPTDEGNTNGKKRSKDEASDNSDEPELNESPPKRPRTESDEEPVQLSDSESYASNDYDSDKNQPTLESKDEESAEDTDDVVCLN